MRGPTKPEKPASQPGIRAPVFARRPDSARRKAWMLLLITLAALLPVGIGLAVSQLAGSAPTPGDRSKAPSVTASTLGSSARARPVG